jgi:hypothetical protein
MRYRLRPGGDASGAPQEPTIPNYHTDAGPFSAKVRPRGHCLTNRRHWF